MSENYFNETCPQCGAKGKAVKAITIDSQLTDEAKAGLAGYEGFRFCATGDCPVAYYRPEDGERVDKSRVRVPIFQKEESPERMVCYCFSHSVQKVQNEILESGESQVIRDIKNSCQRGMDDCARNNPQGSCCLGNISKVVKKAKGLVAATSDQEGVDCGCGPENELPVVADASSEPASCCNEGQCESDASHSATGVRALGKQAPKLALTGALFAAMASSACCWLPLLLLGTGLSTLGVSSFFESNRLYFVLGSVALLGVGFYLVYFRKPVCLEGTACESTSRGLQRFTRSMLWIATIMIAAFTLFPNALSVWAKSREKPAAVLAASDSEMQKLVFAVDGMTCEACAVHAQNALFKVPGVTHSEVDYSSRSATVIADETIKSEVIAKAISELGYSAKGLTK